MTLTGANLLFALLVAHALCDYPLQGDFLARAKNHKDALGKDLWKLCLPAHAAIHGGAVLILTGSVGLAIMDSLAHGWTDYRKSNGDLTFAEDQAAHVIWRVVLWGVAMAVSWINALPISVD